MVAGHEASPYVIVYTCFTHCSDDVVRREVNFCGLGCKTIYDLKNSFALKDNSTD